MVSTYINQLNKTQATSSILSLVNMPRYTENHLRRHARREPDVPTRRIAELYGVPRKV